MQDEGGSQDLLGGERPEAPPPAAVEQASAAPKSLPAGDDPLYAGAPRPPRPGYLIAMVLGGVSVLLGFLLLLNVLRVTGHLPPPALSNSVCIDEKLRFLRNTPPQDPNLLVVGSSVAWRGISGEALTAAAPDVRPLNGGFCGLHTNQTRFVTDWLLRHLPHTRSILMLTVPEDFAGCAKVDTAVFDVHETDAYVFGHAWPWSFYYRDFDPISLMRNAWRIAAQRENRIPLDPLVFTRTGDGPLDTSVTRGTLEYGKMPPFDEACFAALHEMAESATAQGRAFTVVQMPISPEWTRRFDPKGRVRERFGARLDAALSGTGARRWDAGTHVELPDSAFTDAIHLRWSAVPALSDAIARQLLDQSR